MCPRGSRSEHVLEIVERVQEVAPADREAYLEEACGSDDALRAEVDELLSFEEPDGEEAKLIPGDAAAFIDRFKEQLQSATLHAETRLRHEELLDGLLERLAEYGAPIERYHLLEPIGRGGMGEVFVALDRVLRRRVALKRVRGDADDRGAPVDPGRQIRFLHEAQITGQIDHPNVPTVHEIGIDGDGRLFFTLPLVQGESLEQLLDRVGAHAAWEHPHVLDGLVQAARAVAQAHEQGVVHRDLKPANLMIGRHGEMQVMDWGIARVVDEDLARDVLYGPDVDPRVASDLSEAAARDAAFETVAGATLGTPSYMAPEQADADAGVVGPAADVYALGAILYRVLSGRAPYTDAVSRDGGSPTAHDVTARVRAGPPTPVDELARDAPGELVAICRHAMERRPERRFLTVRALVEELEAFRAGRVVKSYEQGAFAELRKWVRRNRALAAALGLALATTLGGTAAVAAIQASREAEARDQLEKIGRLAAMRDLELLLGRLSDLLPATPERLDEFEAWRDEAEEFLHTALDFEAQRAAILENRASVTPDGGIEFATPRDRWWYEQLGEYLALVGELTDPEDGPLYGMSATYGPGVVHRIRWARSLGERQSSSGFLEEWERARVAIAASLKYGGLHLAIDEDLLPLREDPTSGLWEFALLPTGEIPEADPTTGEWRIREETAVVLVLVPGGPFWMGAQKDEEDEPNFAQPAVAWESPVREVELAPYYIAKHELTRGQWWRLHGTTPSTSKSADGSEGALPVDSVSWLEATFVLARAGLELPTEAQWERAARGGTQETRWVGHDRIDLFGRENLDYRRIVGPTLEEFRARYEHDPPDVPPAVHPVDGGAPNPFGLVHVLGNVAEWTRDSWGRYDEPWRPGDGERIVAEPDRPFRVVRGASYADAAYTARSARRKDEEQDLRSREWGVRPARPARPE